MTLRETMYATKEDKKKLPEVTGPQTKTYTKDEFLSATQLSQKLGYPKDVIESAMKLLYFKQTQFIINGHKANVITKQGNRTMRVHPLGIKFLEEQLKKQQGKNK